jgi:multidrug resistance efflux pump
MQLRRPKIRDDLVYAPDAANANYQFVKDPIRAQFFRFNELQVAMMLALDGKHTEAEIADALSAAFEMDIPVESVQRLVARIERDWLLDVSSYRLDSESDRALIRKALRRRGLLWRSKASTSSTSDEKRTQSRETALFECGIEEIETGDPCRAAHYFSEILAINPKNKRAHDVLDTLHKSFFRRHVVRPSYLQMISLWDPDQFLEAVDRRFGRFIFNEWTLSALIMIALLSLDLLLSGHPPTLKSFGWIDIPLFIAIDLMDATLHESGHGLACKHFGGKVHDMGLLLMYGVAPGAYCDTSDSYLFKHRRQKIIVALSGNYASLAFYLVLIWIYGFTSDAFILRNAILMKLAKGGYSVILNFLPLIKADGYYALSDFLEIRNLRERSLGFVARRVQRLLFGFECDDANVTPRERRIFAVYGISSAIFTTAFIYGLWFSTLLPWAIEHLGSIGIVITAVYVLKVAYGLARPSLGLVPRLWRERRKVFTLRRGLAYAVAITGLWAIFSIEWAFYVDGQATIQPLTRTIVTVLEPGLVSSVSTREGDRVEVGQILAELSNPEIEREHDRVEALLGAARHRLELLRLGARPEELARARADANTARVESKHAEHNASRKAALTEARVLSAAAAMNARRMADTQSANSLDASLSLALLEAGARIEDVAQAEAAVAGLESRLRDLDVAQDRLHVRSPGAGIVVAYHLDEVRHRRLEKGQTFCEVHDLSQIRVEIELPKGELADGVHAGDRAAVRMDGDSDHGLASVVSRVRPSASHAGLLIVELEPLANARELRAGLRGHGRIYGRPRSLAYRTFVVPVLRLIRFDAWRFWGT